MRNRNIKLFAVSFVMLFLEIFLIRWISTEVRIFAYLNNLVLLACFLGIGVGCYFSKKETNLLITFGMLVLIVLAVESKPFWNITELLSGFSDSFIWYEATSPRTLIAALNGTLLTVSLFLMILFAFVPLGQILGRIFDEHGNIIAGYSINVASSLAGIWTFNTFSLFYTKPWAWFAFSLAILVFLLPRKALNYLLAGAACGLILLSTGVLDLSSRVLWSPYQRLEVMPNIYSTVRNGYVVNVNNVGFMAMLDLSDSFIKKHPEAYNYSIKRYFQYEIPYQFASSLDNVLIVGAGAGNDAAGAARSGAKDIDAVEIDPGIYKLGLMLHPERPYQRNNVHVTIDDARAYFKKAKKKYDIICFGLLDSHTLSSNYNNTRLDHYVYTEESFEDAKKLLKDDGVITVIFMPRRDWIAERIQCLMKKVFGPDVYAFNLHDPSGAYGWGGIMYVAAKDPGRIRKVLESKPDIRNFVKDNIVRFRNEVKLTTDDWPYLYIKKPGIPKTFILITAAILALIVLANLFLMRTGTAKIDMHFFFLGCAFLLLEFQNVSKAALLFGSTWIVNSYIISAILILILAANLFVYVIKKIRIDIAYAFLLISIAVSYLIPLSYFNAFGYYLKTILSLAVLNLPVFFAGVIFIDSFKRVQSKDAALGSNLIGAAVGGLLESLSFVTGIKALLIAVFVLYAASYYFRKRLFLFNTGA